MWLPNRITFGGRAARSAIGVKIICRILPRNQSAFLATESRFRPSALARKGDVGPFLPFAPDEVDGV
jgi:hypothetical protein